MTDSKSDIAAFYDQFWATENRIAQEEHDFAGFTEPAERALQWLLESGGGLGGRRLLEIGPGRGRDTEAFAGAGASIVAIDISIKSVELARERLREIGLGTSIEAVVADAAQLPFRDASFDISFSRFVIAHVDIPKSGRELARVLRPGGRAVLFEPLDGNPFVRLYRRFAPTGCRETSPRYLKLATLRSIALDFPRGWRHREFFLLSVITLGLRRTPVYEPLRKLAQFVDLGLGLIDPLRGWCWVVVAELRR